MNDDVDDLIGLPKAPQQRVVGISEKTYRRKNRGKLHELISRALPDFCGKDGICNLHRLAAALDMSYQGTHRWMPMDGSGDSIPAARAKAIIELSQRQKTGGSKWKPVSMEDFHPFL
jgi:hypothetical protein